MKRPNKFVHHKLHLFRRVFDFNFNRVLKCSVKIVVTVNVLKNIVYIIKSYFIIEYILCCKILFYYRQYIRIYTYIQDD